MLTCVCRCFNKFVPSGSLKVQLSLLESRKWELSFTAVATNYILPYL